MRIEMNCKNMKNVVAPQDIHRIACVLYANEKGNSIHIIKVIVHGCHSSYRAAQTYFNYERGKPNVQRILWRD